MRLIKTFIFSLFIGIFIPTAGFTYSDHSKSLSVTEEVDSYVEAGDLIKAVDLLSKTLLEDRDDMQARIHLLDLAGSKGLTAKDRINIMLLEDLYVYRDNLSGQISELKDKRNKLGRELVQDGMSLIAIEEEMRIVKDSVLNSNKILPFSEIKRNIDPSSQPLQILTIAINNDNEHFANKKLYLERQYDRLGFLAANKDKMKDVEPDVQVVKKQKPASINRVNKRTIKAPKVKKAKVLTNDELKMIEDEIKPVSIDKEVKRIVKASREDKKKKASQEKKVSFRERISKAFGFGKDKEEDAKMAKAEAKPRKVKRSIKPSKVNQRVASFDAADNGGGSVDRKFDNLRKELDGLETFLVDRDQKLIDLNNQVVDLSLKLAERDAELLKRDTRLSQLNDELTELKARFQLGQKIIEEKEVEISNLREKNDTFKADNKELQSSLIQKEAKVIELNGIVDIYKSNLVDSKTQVKKQAKQILVLEKKLAKSPRQQEIENLVEVQGQHINELERLLEIYKTDLSNAYAALKNRETQIASLGKELLDLQRKFNLRIKAQRAKDNQIALLKDTLQRDRDKRELRNINLRNLVLAKENETAELDGTLEVYKNRLVNTGAKLEEKNNNISTLENQLALAQNTLAQRNKLIDLKKQELDDLENRLFDARKTIADKDGLIEGKEKILTLLEDQLSDAQDTISERDVLLKETRDELDYLQNQLYDMQDELFSIQRNTSSDSSGGGELRLDEKVSDIKSRIDEVNSILTNELKKVNSGASDTMR